MNDLEQMAIERLKAASDMSLKAYQQPLVICMEHDVLPGQTSMEDYLEMMDE